MNLIELVEQARAVVRVWENGRLVDVVLVRYPVCYPEMLTCSSELAKNTLALTPQRAKIEKSRQSGSSCEVSLW